ncbi:hypothetical protein LJC56_10135 [Christensenellaceae bacterium OttesenSCG-928-K19]|nr:hypothetical protein [Christensenellaceae bacterium OttesenSCG-928-K19]
MFDKAMDKLRDEMAANTEDGYIQHVGEYLTDHLRKHPADAAAFLAEGKTVKGSLAEMQKYASKHKRGNCAVVDPATGYKIILEYYGIGAEKTKSADACGIALDLDELLGV